VPYVESALAGHNGPVVAATDYMRAFADQIRPWVRAPYRVLGTDGYGRSDYRKTLRSFFEVDRHYIALAALTELAAAGEVDTGAPRKAIESYGIDAERPAPWRV
jgi:pyruvate dehydrogenase E1 component